MTDALGITVTGLAETFKQLRDVPDKIVNRSIVRVNKIVMAPMLSRARDLAPRGETGALLESLDIKTKAYKRTGTVFTIIGPTVGHRVNLGQRRSSALEAWGTGKTMKTLWHDPVKISHLVEAGHGGPHPAPAHPFLRPAAESQIGSLPARYGSALRAEIERLAKKGVV